MYIVYNKSSTLKQNKTQKQTDVWWDFHVYKINLEGVQGLTKY